MQYSSKKKKESMNKTIVILYYSSLKGQLHYREVLPRDNFVLTSSSKTIFGLIFQDHVTQPLKIAEHQLKSTTVASM